MSNIFLDKSGHVTVVGFISRIVLLFALLIAILFGVFAAYKKVKVWSYAQDGKAQLAQAEWNRQIAVKEALAKQDAAKSLAEAEVIRAKGVAKANKIIGESLEHNEAYLRYLWVNNLAETKNQVIYVPTEANLPILEAGKR